MDEDKTSGDSKEDMTKTSPGADQVLLPAHSLPSSAKTGPPALPEMDFWFPEYPARVMWAAPGPHIEDVAIEKRGQEEVAGVQRSHRGLRAAYLKKQIMAGVWKRWPTGRSQARPPATARPPDLRQLAR